MPILTIHLDDDMLERLRVASKDLDRPVTDLAECAVTESLLRFVPKHSGLYENAHQAELAEQVRKEHCGTCKQLKVKGRFNNCDYNPLIDASKQWCKAWSKRNA